MKKFCAILLSLCLVFAFAACASQVTPTNVSPTSSNLTAEPSKSAVKPTIKVAMLNETTYGGGGFSDYSRIGMETACKEFNIECKAMENVDIATVKNTIYTMVEQGYNLFLYPGAALKDVFIELAPQLPDVHFALFDVKAEGYDNIMSVAFREQEATYLVGALAALESKTGTIGFIGGIEAETIIRWESGFVAGAKTINPDIKIQIAYTGNFSDVAAGKSTAAMMFNQGADFIQAAAGAGNVGLYQLMQESKYTDKWAMGGGVDGQFSQAPNYIVAAPVKLVNNYTYLAVASLIKGTWQGNKAFSVGVAEKGMDILYNKDCLLKVSDKNKAIIDKMRTDILNGTLVPPSTREALAKFVYPSYK